MSQPLPNKMSDETALEYVEVLTRPSRRAKAEGYKQGVKDGRLFGILIGTSIGMIIQIVWEWII